jgi:ribonuclease HI
MSHTANTTGSIKIFTDGSSRGNPGRGGWGAVVLHEHETVSTVTELGGAEAHTTNNRMELQAVIGALDLLKKNLLGDMADVFGVPPVTIYTDSKYVLRGATEWLSGWEAGGWRTAGKTEVMNKDLWQDFSVLFKAFPKKTISWHLLAGHVGVPGNERADVIATEFADSLSNGDAPELFDGQLAEYQEKFGIDLLNISHDTEQKEKRSGAKERSRAKAYSYVSMVGGKILIHKTWAECEARVKGTKGAKYKKSLSPDDEVAVIEEFEKVSKK